MDLKTIKSLVQMMVENDLSRIELREGDTHILLRRGQAPVMNNAPVPAALPAPAQPAAVASADASAAAAPRGPEEHLIRSPMVGTFYASADPDSPPFVQIGDNVTPDTVVCLVEAMKVFNEIKAEAPGRIARILAKNAQAVEYDQPLFALAPA